VPGKEEQPGFRALEPAGELAEGRAQARVVDVDRHDDLEAEVAQGDRDRPGVVGRVRQDRGLLGVGAVADHQGHPAPLAFDAFAGGQPRLRRVNEQHEEGDHRGDRAA
jgi:hypothetical protein